MKNWFIISLISNLLTGIVIGQVNFSEVSIQSGIDVLIPTRRMDGAVSAFFDYDKDGYIDLYLTGGDSLRDHLYHNNGDGTFSDVSIQAGLSFTGDIGAFGVVTGDIDNDGDRDVFLTTGFGTTCQLLLNNGNGIFSNITDSAGFNDEGIYTHAAAFGDYNLDGYLDIYVVSWVKDYIPVKNTANETIGYAHKCYENTFYVNNGDLTFTERSSDYGINDAGCGLATAFSDYDNDHDMDIMVANDFGMWVSPNVLFQNGYPVDTFHNVSVLANMDQEMYGMGIAIGDYDHDLDLDYYFTSIGRNFFMQNQNDGSFIDLTDSLGVQDDSISTNSIYEKTSWGTAFLDVNNDMYVDLFVADGKVPAFFPTAPEDPNKLYLNDKNGGFEDISAIAGIDNTDRCRAMIYGDYDNDGDLDVFVSVIDHVDSLNVKHCLLYRNDFIGNNNWLQVDLEGITCNRDAYGAHIKIVIGNESWIHEIDGGSSYRSQHSSTAHFGLGMSAEADSLIITWPGGKMQYMTNITANQKILILEDTTKTTISTFLDEEIENKLHNLELFPNPNNADFTLNFISGKNEKLSIQIFNLSGQQLYNTSDIHVTAGENTISMKINDLTKGAYFVYIESGSRIYRKKMLVF